MSQQRSELLLEEIRSRHAGGLILMGLAILVCLSICLLPRIDVGINLVIIGWKAGIYPTPLALIDYTDQKITLGMKREDVNKILDEVSVSLKIHNYVNENEICDSIGVYIGYFPLNRLEYRMCYDLDLYLKDITRHQDS